MTNISSSVVTPPVTGQASQRPSPAPGVLSQKASLPAQSTPLLGPSMHAHEETGQDEPTGLDAVLTRGAARGGAVVVLAAVAECAVGLAAVVEDGRLEVELDGLYSKLS